MTAKKRNLGATLLLLFLSTVGLGLLWMAISTTYLYWRVFYANPQTTTGKVVDKHFTYTSKGLLSGEMLVVDYDVGQGAMNQVNDTFVIGEHQLGDILPVYYDKDHPRLSAIKDKANIGGLAFIQLLISAFFLWTPIVYGPKVVRSIRWNLKRR